jgi:hypothetical protein
VSVDGARAPEGQRGRYFAFDPAEFARPPINAIPSSSL